MPALNSVQVLLCSQDAQLSRYVREAIQSSDLTIVDREPCSQATLRSADYDLAIICVSGQDGQIEEVCRRLRQELADAFVPILLLTDPAGCGSRLLEHVDMWLHLPLEAKELSAQIRALVRLKKSHQQLMVNRSPKPDATRLLSQAHAQLRASSDLAGRIQSTLLPRQMPSAPPWRFAVHHRPRERTGGDLYDVFRLDEDHVGFFLADLMAHGVGAGLLGVFLKRALCTKEIEGNSYRLLQPTEALTRLNRELLALELPERPFVMMLYGILGARDSRVAFASAGNHSALYLPRGGTPSFLSSPGSFLGVHDTFLTNQTQVLRPGDKLLFASDGVGGGPDSANSALLAAATRAREMPVEELVANVSMDLLDCCPDPDDFTLLGVELTSPAA
jgi:sigma-B regulation protein RsbU (phosphoserine phosphatase)